MQQAQNVVIRWEEPPASKGIGRKSRWASVARQLQQRPGEWAVIDDGAKHTSTANHINNGKIAEFRPAGSFEAVARKSNGLHVIYARFVGGGDD